MHVLAAPAVMGLMVAAGCLAPIIGGHADSTREFTCMVLGDRPDRLAVTVVAEVGLAEPTDAILVVRDRVADASLRPLSHVDLEVGAEVERPEEGWTAEALFDLAGTVRNDRLTVRLGILWLSELQDVPGNGVLLAPGVLAVNASTLDGRPSEVVAAVLLHNVGHALGQVNDGVPMKTNHEGPPKHEPDEDSVMHEVWHEMFAPLTIPPPLTYSDAVREDWALAWSEEGVCG